MPPTKAETIHSFIVSDMNNRGGFIESKSLFYAEGIIYVKRKSQNFIGEIKYSKNIRPVQIYPHVQ